VEHTTSVSVVESLALVLCGRSRETGSDPLASVFEPHPAHDRCCLFRRRPIE